MARRIRSDGSGPAADAKADDRRSFATEELDEATVERIAMTRMNPRHRHLDRMLEEN